jgi:hypothetical protein
VPDSKESPSVQGLRAKNERLKIWVGLIALVLSNAVALYTSLSASSKAEDETKAKAAYTELSSAVKDMSKDNIQIHNDLSNLRGYLAGLAQNGALSIPKVATIETPKPAHTSASIVGVSPNISTSKPKSSASSISFKSAPEPPKIGVKPQQYEPQLLGKKW